jgi:xylan 1,4-beta-xylosidase
MQTFCWGVFLAAILFLRVAAEEASPAVNAGLAAVRIQVDAAQGQGELTPIWRFFGADEPNYAYMTNGRKLLAELGELAPTRVYFRTHNLLNSGDGAPALKWGSTGAYGEEANGQPVYNWSIVDRIFDTYLQSGVRPYVEIGFMPREFSIKPEPYQHHWNPELPYNEVFTGWSYPPRDYHKWSELVYQWAAHCVDRYGRSEVETWFWEVWNEPNIGYWHGTREEFLKLHDYAVEGVRRALPTARVGGADTAGSGGRFTRDFIEHCLRGTNYVTGKHGTPLDFVSFHAKGAPVYTNGHARMGMANQLRTIEDGFRIISSYPELRACPVVIGESDPEGCAACQGPQLAYRNGTMYSSYTAASLARIYDLSAKYHVNLEGALTWAFEFEDQPYFAGFRSLASNGIDKPVLNVFRMLSRMHGRRIAVTSSGAVPLEAILTRGVVTAPDVSALACLDERTLSILVWHYHDDDIAGPDAPVEIVLDHLPSPPAGRPRVQHFRVDEDHSNAFALWKKMGSPGQLTAEQRSRLEDGGRLAEAPAPGLQRLDNGQIQLSFVLPRQAVSLVLISW